MQTLLNRHIQKIRIPTKIQLITLIHSRASLDEQVNKCTVNNSGANLALDIVPSNRQLLLLELARPLLLRRYELGYTIDEATPGVQCRLCIEPGTLVTTARMLIPQNTGLRTGHPISALTGCASFIV